MRIVDRQTFLNLPSGTLYAKWGEPGRRDAMYDHGLTIKGETYRDRDGRNIDWAYDDLIPTPADCPDGDQVVDRYFAMQEEGADSGPLDFDGGSRDGLFDTDQLFLVFAQADHEGLIARLQRALTDQKANP